MKKTYSNPVATYIEINAELDCLSGSNEGSLENLNTVSFNDLKNL